jgi:thioredoxin-like negative regulator of GroEL
METMPEEIREDWFRLSLYRSMPEEASRAAASLIHLRSVDTADELLQTIVQGGWTNHALPLYREIHRAQPRNELVRRRMVALCIKEGQLDEARRIASAAPLRFAA